MKVITKCIIDMETFEVEKEESYEYSGPVAECKGGGGGSSGTTDFPDYIKEAHAQLLSNTALGDVVLSDNPTSSIIDALNSAVGNSPWAGQVAYDPAADITAAEAFVTAFAAVLAGIDEETDFDDYHTQAVTTMGAFVPQVVADAVAVPDEVVGDIATADMAGVTGIEEADIVNDIDAFADQLDDQIDTDVLPRFESGMRDINMVVSSAFPIGRAVIEGFRDRDVSKHGTQLRIAAAEKNADIDLEVGKSNLMKELEVDKSNMSKDIEVGKINITKNLDVDKTNVSKNIDVAKVNVSGEVSYVNAYISAVAQMMSLMNQRLSLEDSYMKIGIETKRIKIVANKEETDFNIKIDEKDALWDIEAYQYAANMLASASGGVETTGSKDPSTAQSVLGGAMSGAAAGAMVGGPHGAVIGGVLGAASGLL